MAKKFTYSRNFYQNRQKIGSRIGKFLISTPLSNSVPHMHGCTPARNLPLGQKWLSSAQKNGKKSNPKLETFRFPAPPQISSRTCIVRPDPIFRSWRTFAKNFIIEPAYLFHVACLGREIFSIPADFLNHHFLNHWTKLGRVAFY